MKKIFWLILAVFTLWFAGATTADAQVDGFRVYLSDDGECRRLTNNFHPWDVIYAFVVFSPTGQEQEMKFRWFAATGEEEQIYSYSFNNIKKPGEQCAIFSWLALHPFPNGTYSPKFLGQWMLKIFLDGKKIADRQFLVSEENEEGKK